MTPGASAPSRGKLLRRGLTGRCAVCGKSRLTLAWVKVSSHCPRCHLPLERKEGHFVGAVGMNTIVTFGVILIAVVVGAIVTSPETPVVALSIIVASLGLFVSVAFFPISKTLWSAIDVAMVPLEPGEVDPRYDPTVIFSEPGPSQPDSGRDS